MKNVSKCEIYHERQIQELCALHALNNLFQAHAFTKTGLDTVCRTLSPNNWINPHRSMLGTGNYDINVIISALQSKGMEVIWYDLRKDPRCLCLNNIYGFILNIPTDYKLGILRIPLGRRHWISIRQINGHYYNLDSKLDAPLLIGDDAALLKYLRDQLRSGDKQLILVVNKDVETTQTWQNSNQSISTNIRHSRDDSDVSSDVECLRIADISPCDIENDHSTVTFNPLCKSNDEKV